MWVMMTVGIPSALSVRLPTAPLVLPFYKLGNGGTKRWRYSRLWSRPGVKSRQSGSRTYCLNLFIIGDCCSVNFCGVTLPESPWAPVLLARASQRMTSHFFIFHQMALLCATQRYAHTSWGCSPAAHLWGRGGRQALSLVTSLVFFPGFLWEHIQVTHWRDLSELYSYWWRQILIRYVWGEAVDSPFPITFQVMLALLVCTWGLRDREPAQKMLLPELLSPSLCLQLMPLNIKILRCDIEWA